jgi:hypothetical protein
MIRHQPVPPTPGPRWTPTAARRRGAAGPRPPRACRRSCRVPSVGPAAVPLTAATTTRQDPAWHCPSTPPHIRAGPEDIGPRASAVKTCLRWRSCSEAAPAADSPACLSGSPAMACPWPPLRVGRSLPLGNRRTQGPLPAGEGRGGDGRSLRARPQRGLRVGRVVGPLRPRAALPCIAPECLLHPSPAPFLLSSFLHPSCYTQMQKSDSFMEIKELHSVPHTNGYGKVGLFSPSGPTRITKAHQIIRPKHSMKVKAVAARPIVPSVPGRRPAPVYK